MKPVAKPTHKCGECRHAYDFHEIGANGKPFLCRCPYWKDGKFCRFIEEKACDEHFEPKD